MKILLEDMIKIFAKMNFFNEKEEDL